MLICLPKRSTSCCQAIGQLSGIHSSDLDLIPTYTRISATERTRLKTHSIISFTFSILSIRYGFSTLLSNIPFFYFLRPARQKIFVLSCNFGTSYDQTADPKLQFYYPGLDIRQSILLISAHGKSINTWILVQNSSCTSECYSQNMDI